MTYLREKLYQATLSLIRPSPLDERLQYAGTVLLRIQDDYQFKNADDRDSFLEVMGKLTAPIECGPEGSIAANIAKMSDDEKLKIAEEIVGMLWQSDLDQ
jgi:hypothetical protein